MTTEDFIIDLFCRVDDRMKNVPNHSQASLWPSELVTIGLLFAVKGVGQRAFYRWLRDVATRLSGVSWVTVRCAASKPTRGHACEAISSASRAS